MMAIFEQQSVCGDTGLQIYASKFCLITVNTIAGAEMDIYRGTQCT